MSKIKTYFQQTSDELINKVSWPTWSELQASAIIVMIASIIIAFIIFAMDWSFSKLMEAFYGLF